LPLIGAVDRSGGASDTGRPRSPDYNGEDDPLPMQAGGWTFGNWVFSDRDYTWNVVPAEMDGAEYICTFNNDKNVSTVTYTVTFPIGATVLLTCDDRLENMQDAVDAVVSGFADAGDFTDTGWDVHVFGDGDPPGRQLSVFSAAVAPGTYVFGAQESGRNFYVIGALDPPAPMRKAHSPDPAHESRTPPSGVEGDGFYMLLQFTAGYGATTHTAYFSDVEQEVIDRSPAVSLGSPPYPAYYPTGYYAGMDDENLPEFARTPLERGVIYYWTVVESNDTSTVVGDVWSFTIASEKAYSPTPPDGAQYINGASVDLAWLMGDVSSDDYLISYDVYWGTDEAAVAADEAPDAHVTDPAHVIGPLLFDQDYYWKVNTVVTDKGPPWGTRIVPGDVWHFQTKPFVEITDPTRIGWWKFDEDSGDVVIDHSGYNNDGTIQGGAQRVAGKIDDAIDLSGSGQSVQIVLVGGVPTTVNPPEVSVAMWAKPDITTGQRMMWFTHETSGHGKIRCRIDGGNWQMRSGQGATADNINAVGPAAVAGEWAHYVGMKIDNDALYVYIDGELGGRADFLVGGDLSPNSWIGAEEGNNNYFDGLIDDVQVYLRALSLKEIKLMAGRLSATDPNPADGATDVPRTMPILSWSPGALAAAVSGNELYYGENLSAVQNRTATKVTLDGPPYTVLLTLDLGATFYWAVDTVNDVEDDSPWPGDLWSFTTTDWLSVDDMEPYVIWSNPAGPHIFVAWRDGFGNCVVGNGNDTGAVLTEITAPVFAGLQSMKYDYDNDGTVYSPCTMGLVSGHKMYSKIEAQIATLLSGIGTDWTIQGVRALSLRFYGTATNIVEPMWVQLQDATKGYGEKVTYGDYEDEDPNDITDEAWHEWFIDLADFDVDANNLVSMSIGFGNEDETGPHGSGTVYFDDFRLYTPKCFAARHSEELARVDFAPLGAPDCVVNYKELDVMADDWLLTDTLETGELLVRWQFDETAGVIANDASGNARHGDVNDVNGVSWTFDAERGRCLDFAGGDHVLDNDANTYLNDLHGLTISVWVKNRETTATDQGFIIFDDPIGNDDRDMRYDAEGANGGGTPSVIKCGVTTTATVGNAIQQLESSEYAQTTAWQHLALTWSTGEQLKLYIDGALDTPTANRPGTVGVTTGATKLIVGKGGKGNVAGGGWNGLIDDVQIYNYALSATEIATVKAGGAIAPKPVHYPVPSPAEIHEGEAQGSRAVNFKDYAELLDNWLFEIKYPR